MSAEDDDTQPILRMVTAPYRSRADEEMTAIGLLYGAGLVLVLLPLLPFIVIVWALGVIRDAVSPQPEH